jgi:protein TonB
MFRSRSSIIYTLSLLLHAGVAVAVVRIKEPEMREATRISISEVRKPKAKAKVEAPPPPASAPAARKIVKKAPAAAPAPPPTAAPVAAPLATFGLTLSGGIGIGASSGGIAVPVGPATRVQPTTTRTAAPKELSVKPRARGPAIEQQDSCVETLVKPKPIAIPQPVYAERAREARIEGKVRVELTVDEHGQVVQAKVLESLGYGLDEAALDAARAARFEPATRCGTPMATTFVIGIRFTL